MSTAECPPWGQLVTFQEEASAFFYQPECFYCTVYNKRTVATGSCAITHARRRE